jgi:SPP1 gp7 family putative phage head morphogenesis protein
VPNARAQQTAARLHSLRLFGAVKRRRPMPRQRYPKLIELEYAKAIIGIVSLARPAFAPLLAELPRLLAAAVANRRADDESSEGARASRLIQQAQEHMRAAIQPRAIEQLAGKFADRTQRWQGEQLRNQARAALGADVFISDRKVPTLVDHFVAENVALIRAVPEEVAAGVAKLATRAFSTGMPHPELAKHIEERFQVGESRARLIARDQVGKLAGQVNAARQQALGITRFTWRTVGDERVRPEHEDLDGQEFSYDDPPDEGLPGEPVQCRCSAEPIFDDILSAANDDEAGAADADDSDAA